MKKFARIDNGAVVELLDANELPEFHPALQWIECPAAVGVGWSFDGGGFAPPVADHGVLWAAYQHQAQALLAKSDTTVMRCVEAGVAVPSDWIAYRSALRSIISAASGDLSQPLPLRPADYPPGT